MLELKNILNKRYLADIDGSPQANTKEYIFFSVSHGTFSNIDPILTYVGHAEVFRKTDRARGSGSLL